MAGLNPLSREENVQGSIKKFFVDVFGDSLVTFDKSLASPDVRTDTTKVQWLLIQFGTFARNDLADYTLTISCMTRKDPESVELAKLVDSVMALLLDSTKSDGMGRIPLYDVSILPWVKIGGMAVQEVVDSFPFEMAGDETKARILSARLRWGAAI